MKNTRKPATAATTTGAEPTPPNAESAVQASGQANNSRLTVEQFTLLAIERLADEGRATIHTVFSGFNDAFRDYFPGLNPVTETEKLVKEGKVAFRFCRGGAIIGKPGAIKAPEPSKAALKKMGLS